MTTPSRAARTTLPPAPTTVPPTLPTIGPAPVAVSAPSIGMSSLLQHVGLPDSRSGPAVFYGLADLRPGDVEVTLADTSVAHYVVSGTEQFPKAEFPSFAVFGATSDDVLRLVTCTGEFNFSIRSYYDNLVVTAVRAPGG